MRTIWILLLCLSGALTVAAQTRVQKPVGTHPTAFAIIIDQLTYDKTKPAVDAYRDALETDGLATYIISGKWKNPDQVKEEIIKINKRRPPLEGVVFIGDIPIAFVRNAQHMTTAFKMNEETFPIQQSSVPSDRFYDDLHLGFDYIRQDSLNPLHFYYKLREDSPQQLRPTFYSARIRYPEEKGGDKYAEITRYLEKVVRIKKQQNPLDHFTSYTGDAYNSECLIAWMDERLALKENFPLAWTDNSAARFLNFRMHPRMKFSLFDELQRDELDVMLFHEHGSPDKQHINEVPAGTDMSSCYGILKSSIYEMVSEELKKGKKKPEDIYAYYRKEFGLDLTFFKDMGSPEMIRHDSLEIADRRISLEDLSRLSTYPKFVMFDACYNGSFHQPGYIAGYYIFNDGNTVVTQGNTQNVLQDRWTIEMIGLLTYGVRVGQWNRQIATLEGHLQGDPTFHFTPSVANTLGEDIVLRSVDNALWEKNLSSSAPAIQAVALRMLTDNDTGKNFSGRLLKVFCESPFHSVRMEALKLLSRYDNADFTEAVRLGLYDVYELIRRNAAAYAGQIGDEVLVPDLVDVYLNYPESQRVNYSLEKALQLFEPSVVKKTIGERQADMLDRMTKRNISDLALMQNTEAADQQRIVAVRSVRNNPFHYNVEHYLKMLADPDVAIEIRVNLAEALGWFKDSVRKSRIIEACRQMLDKPQPTELKAELMQTINRLK